MPLERPTYEALEERLHKLEAVVQECERLSVANRYAAAIMHEVNNPLEAITNLAYLIQQEPQTSEAGENLALLQEQIIVLTAVTRPSLAFYRDRNEAKKIDLAVLIESVAKLHAGRLLSEKIELHQLCPTEASCEVIGSELLQVLSNLVLNAVDALAEGKQGGNIHIRVSHCSDCIHLLVADDGPGVPAHLEKSLFEAHATGKPKGSGLGLWISERIIRNHNGRVRYRTSRRAGKTGTAFRISLPCHASA